MFSILNNYMTGAFLRCPPVINRYFRLFSFGFQYKSSPFEIHFDFFSLLVRHHCSNMDSCTPNKMLLYES
eukprot:m.97572 g.97572  ORF g.97572 m.97572 type:complete len:70 (+) comp13602_c0_seq1:930-1139(+)